MLGCLLERLDEFGERPAMVWQGRDYSYRELREAVGFWRGQLAARGIEAGESVALRGSYSPGICSLLVALILNRNVVVPLGRYSVGQETSLLEVGRVGAVFGSVDGNACTFHRRPAPEDHPLLNQLRDGGEPGLILFTSGSTGDRKAALLSFDRLLGRFMSRRPAFRTLAFMEPDHIGGINTLFHVLCTGGTLIPVPERGVQAVGRAIERERGQLLPTTPTFLNMLMISQAYKEYDLSSLELITYGSEPMPASTLQALNRVFPHVRFKQTYGLSELGILPTASEGPQSLWLRIGGEGCETKVVDGTLWIRARSAMLGYLNAPSPFDGDGWLNTGDAVEIKGDHLRILGRASEAINVGGEKVFPTEVESVLLQMPNVGEAMVYGKPNPVTGRVVAAVVRLLRPEDPDHLEQRMRVFCQGRLDEYKVPALLEVDAVELHGARFKKIRDRGRGNRA